MIRRIAPVFAVLICVYLDIIFFARANIFGVRPDAMLALSVSYGVLTGPLSGAVIGMAGGLLSDLLAGTALGLNAAMYLISGMAGGFFFKKFYADNIIVPSVTAMACGFSKDLIMALIRLIGGARYSFAQALIGYILPCALISGVLCALIHVMLKSMVARQIKRTDQSAARE